MNTSQQNISLSEDYDYSFIFDDLSDKLNTGRVHVTKLHAKRGAQKAYTMCVAVQDADLRKREVPVMPSRIADCIDIAAAVSVADRLCIRSINASACIHVLVPVRCPAYWQDEIVRRNLQSLLHWYTRDNWTFDFSQRTATQRFSEKPAILEKQAWLPYISDHVDLASSADIAHGFLGVLETVLWSGGLDALAGLYERILTSSTNRFTLFSTGSNDNMQKVQRDLAERLSQILAASPGREVQLKLIQVPVRIAKEINSPVRTVHRSKGQRARGFVFTLLGAVCAYLEGQRALSLFENGPGAINLRYRDSEVGRDHAVPVHPLSLIKMGHFFSYVIEEPFTIQNPALLQTKAQMCTVLRTPELCKLILETVSCDRPRREIPQQCGCCASCLLRRQALLFLGIEDSPELYGVLSGVTGGQPYSTHRPFKTVYLQSMLHQVDKLKELLARDNPWQALTTQRGYGTLAQIVDATSQEPNNASISPEQIVTLYRTYADEWNEYVRRELSRGLLDRELIAINSDARNQAANKLSNLELLHMHRITGVFGEMVGYTQLSFDDYMKGTIYAS